MEILEPSVQMWLTFGLISTGIFFYVLDKYPMELVSLGIIVALLLLFHIMPLHGEDDKVLINTRSLLEGLADPALISILALLVVGHGIVETGALDSPVKFLIRLSSAYPVAVIVISLLVVMFISAFLNNTPVVVIFIPIMITLAENLGKSPSIYLMPLSFVAILGGMTTLIGSSTNLLVSESLRTIGGIELGFFDFAIPGIFLAFIGFLYVLFIAPYILPKDRTTSSKDTQITGKQFIVQIDLTEGNTLIGHKAVAGMFPILSGLTVQLVRRGTKTFLPPFDDISLEKGDQLILAATRKELTDKIAKEHLLLSDVKGHSDDDRKKTDREDQVPYRGQKLVEVVIMQESKLDGRTLEQSGFSLPGGCKILGIQRRSRMNRTTINDIKLESNDTLLAIGTQQEIQSLRLNNDVLLLEWSAKEIPIIADMWKSMFIFMSVVFLASTGILPIAISSLLGAFAMIVTGCLSIKKATSAIDRNIFLLIGAALAMGTSLQATGGASYIAMHMVTLLNGASPTIILSAFFLLIAFMTNILSNNATAVLFTPIAINMAHEINIDPFIFVVTVIFAANCSFATPMGYKTNLLVFGPGNYKFADFIKVGVPLILLLWVSYTFFAPWYYEL
ncbi:MAG: SLC13 family permease [Kordiimonadaceae bacterium]|nr:SLC13 family permease [Kordiimonadaceae bacterium]